MTRTAARAFSLPWPRLARGLLLTAALCTLSGCALFAVVAAKQRVMVKPTYTGFKDQSVGVMVWADRGMRNDHGAIQIDIARGIDGKMKEAQAGGAEELKGTQFPKNRGPDAMLNYQRNYPGAADSILDVAPRLGVSRLIYVEIGDFELHPENVPELFRGHLSGNVQVIEVANGKARAAFSEQVMVDFPENAPPEGTPNGTEESMYRMTVQAFTIAVAQKFTTYERDP